MTVGVAQIRAEFSTADLYGKVMHIAKEGFLKEWRTGPDMEEGLPDRAWNGATEPL